MNWGRGIIQSIVAAFGLVYFLYCLSILFFTDLCLNLHHFLASKSFGFGMLFSPNSLRGKFRLLICNPFIPQWTLRLFSGLSCCK